MRYEKRELITSLLKKYASDNGTETLIGFIADSNGMLAACKEVFDKNGGVHPALIEWLQVECKNHNVAYMSFWQSVKQILILFSGQYESDDHYAVLGLSPTASIEEVKAAYRKLSFKHHPDKAYKSNDEYDPQKFIEISKAYHAITNLERQEAEGENTERAYTEWNSTKKRNINKGQKKIITFWLFGLLFLLVIISVVGTLNVRKRAMIAGLSENRGAFVPPSQKMDTLSQKQHIKDPIDEQRFEKSVFVFQKGGTEDNFGKEIPETTETKPVQDNFMTFQPNKEHGRKTKVIHTADATSKKIKKLYVSKNTQKEKEDFLDEPANREKILAGLEKKERVSNLRGGKTKKTDELTLLNSENGNSEPLVQELHEYSKNSQINVPVKNRYYSEITEFKQASQSVQKTAIQTDPDKEKSEVIADESTEGMQVLEMQKRIEIFLRGYEEAYAKKNIILFSRYFKPDAIENEKPFTEMVPVYNELFKVTSNVFLSVNVISWRKIDGEIHLHGRFSVSLDYLDGTEVMGSGPIFFELRDVSNTLLVELLTYSFDT